MKKIKADFDKTIIKYGEMEYTTCMQRKILVIGEYKGYSIYIMNYGTHPCAYIQIPKNNIFYEKDYCERIYDKLCVHGGITYAANHLNLGDIEICEGWFIGWDYAHAFDYNGMLANMLSSGIYNGGKKYTVDEILDDIYEVVEQIITLNKKRKK